MPAAVLIAVSESKEYDGKPLTKSGSDGYEITGTLGDYKLVVTYNTITEVGSVDTISTYVVNATKGSQTQIKTALWALSTLIFVLVIVVVIIMNWNANRNSRKEDRI